MSNITEQSSIENPLGFFDFYFVHNGYKNDYKRFFIGVEYLFDFIEEVNHDEDYIAYLNNNCEGIDWIRKDYFKDQLNAKLESQFNLSIQYISQNIIASHKAKVDIPISLKILIGQLNNLIYAIKNSKELSKYPFPLECIYKLIIHLHTVYNAFFTEIQSDCIVESFKYFKDKEHLANNQGFKKTKHLNEEEKQKLSVSTFKWIDEPAPEKYTFFLYNILTKRGVIDTDNTTQDKFRKAFSGEIIEVPLEIKWKLKTRKRHTKPSLIRVFNMLMFKLNLLEKMRPSDFAIALESIFVNSEGENIENIEESQNQISVEGDFMEKELIKGIMSLFPDRNAKYSTNP